MRTPSVPATLLLALALAGPPARSAAAAPPGVAVLGLRPVEDRAGGPTALARLAEAQRLRAALERVVEVLSSPPLGHEALRTALGRGYLVDLFDCRGDAACQLRVAGPLRALGVTTALVGDYASDAAGHRVTLRRLDLVRGRATGEAGFQVPLADAEGLVPWRRGVAPLFEDTGSIALVVSATGTGCTLDGRPCDLGPDGVIAAVPQGEHLLVITKEGHHKASRVVTVTPGERVRVAVVMEELPIQATKAPEPTSRLPTFEAPGDESRIEPFGFLRLAFLVDDVDGGEREEPAVPLGVPRRAGLVVLPRPALLGVSMQAPKQESGWQLRGALSLGFVKDAGPELDSAFAELLQEDLGFRLLLGWGPGPVSGLTAGTLTSPEGFGDLSAGLVGLTASKSFGPVVLEAFVGKHKSQFGVDLAPGATSPAPFLAGRLAFVDSGRSGSLYGEPFPLTVAVSALSGRERVGGADEAAWAAGAGLAAPAAELVPVRLLSAELFLPLGPWLGLAGEGWVGDGVHLLEGALWQGPRMDPVTGRHRVLRSAGGWLQLSAALGEAVELRALAGTDRAVSGLDAGRAPFDEPAVSRNEVAALAAVWRVVKGLALGLQVHAVRTAYLDPAAGSPVAKGVTLTSQLQF